MSDYGIPYMGSKAKIMPSIAMNFPSAENFYDLFGGGFSVTHYMMERCRNRYKQFHYNEIKSDVVGLIKRAIAGEFNYKVFKPEWISREEFFKRKNTDAYVRCVWSFGNNQKGYLFNEDIEKIKRSMHQAVVFGEFDESMSKVFGLKRWNLALNDIKKRRLFLKKCIRGRVGLQQLEHLERLQRLERLQQLEQLERLQRLQQLEQLQQLEFYSDSYQNIPIKPDSIVYCDIPYKDTEGYLNKFNRSDFFDWAATRTFPVYISEYLIEDSRFKLVYEVDKRSMLSPNKSVGNKSERLYWNGVTNLQSGVV